MGGRMRRWLSGLIICIGVCYVVPGTAQIAQAPAFTASQLSAPPTAGWLTNGGSLSNQRYSPLAQINRDTVSRLKAVWRASLHGSGLSARSGNQAQPLVYAGVIYIMTGENDV